MDIYSLSLVYFAQDKQNLDSLAKKDRLSKPIKL